MEKFYVITVDGHAITSPMTLADLVANHGSVQAIESSGHRIVAVN